MSTKVAENCPKCGTATMPTDKALPVKEMPFRLWRHVCESCGHVWVNEAQRKHNEDALEKHYKLVHQIWKSVNGIMYD